MSLFMVFILGFLLSRQTTKWAIILATKYNIRDIPGHRSSHDTPTPRIGGVGIVSSFLTLLLVIILYSFLSKQNVPWLFVLLIIVGGGIAFAFGLWDDLKGMRVFLKFFLQALCALLPVFAGIKVHSLARIVGLTFSPVWGSVLAFCWIMLMMNAFNFMDGMNGLAGSFAATAFLFMALMIQISANPFPVLVIISLAGCCCGFLVYNLTPAKTFMGDCGSQFLGYMLALCPLYIHTGLGNSYPMGAFVILFLPFLYDVIFTIFRRLIKGENILRAHRSHLYQRLLRSGWSHARVLRLLYASFILCGILALFFVKAETPINHILIFAASMLIMIVYTTFVWKVSSSGS